MDGVFVLRAGIRIGIASLTLDTGLWGGHSEDILNGEASDSQWELKPLMNL